MKVNSILMLATCLAVVGCSGSSGSNNQTGDQAGTDLGVTDLDLSAADGAQDLGLTDLGDEELKQDGASTVPGDSADQSVVEPVTIHLEPPDFFTEAFTIHVDTSSTIGLVGDTFRVKHRLARGAPEGEVDFVYESSESVTIEVDEDGILATVTAEGMHLVTVTATDQSGNTTQEGVVLVAFQDGPDWIVGDVDGDGALTGKDHDLVELYLFGDGELTAEQFERADITLDGKITIQDNAWLMSSVLQGLASVEMVSHPSGAPGRKVLWAHPSLTEPGAIVQIKMGDADAFVPVRTRPGYALFVVPPDLIGTRGKIDMSIVVDDIPVVTREFDLVDLPAASEVPGEKLVKAMEDLRYVLQYMPAVVDAYLIAVEAEPDEAAVLTGMLDMAVGSFNLHEAAFQETLQQMEAEGRGALEQIALANDLDMTLNALTEARLAIQALEEEGAFGDRLSIAQASVIINLLCTALDIADISGKVAEINEIAGAYLAWFDWWPLNVVPIVGQVISFLRSINSALGAITDIIGTVAEYLPEFGPVKIEATPPTLQVGSSAAVEAYLQIVIATKLCLKAGAGVVDGIMERLTDALTKRLASSIPLVSGSFKAAKFSTDKMNWVLKLIYKAISAIAGKVLDAIGVQGLLEKLVDRVCGLFSDPWLPIDATFVQSSCGAIAGGSWTCTTDCTGSVNLGGETEVCKKNKVANTIVTCQGCDPDSCPQGCCDQENCLTYGQQSDAKCGTGGTPCSACPEFHTCQQGQCVCTSTCQNEGAKQCAGPTTVEVCTKVADDPQCLVWKTGQTCENGNTCEDGECQGGCNATNCPGCCLPGGDCVDPPTHDNCGKNGETCGYCFQDQQCVDGKCEGGTTCCAASETGVYSEVEGPCPDGSSTVNPGPCPDICCPSGAGFGEVMPFSDCGSAAVAPDLCEEMCLGKTPVSWSVKYDFSAGGTGFGKQGSDPLGTYNGDCYGQNQSLTVTAGTAPNTYVAQPENTCLESMPVDPGENCIYCDKCPAGTAVTMSQINQNWWQGTCNQYTVTLKAGCP